MQLIGIEKDQNFSKRFLRRFKRHPEDEAIFGSLFWGESQAVVFEWDKGCWEVEVGQKLPYLDFLNSIPGVVCLMAVDRRFVRVISIRGYKGIQKCLNDLKGLFGDPLNPNELDEATKSQYLRNAFGSPHSTSWHSKSRACLLLSCEHLTNSCSRVHGAD